MKKGVFIETDNVTLFRAALRQAEDTERGRPGMVAVWGEAGVGKTLAAHSMYAQHGGVFLRVVGGLTAHALLQALCWELRGSRPHGAQRCMAEILRALEEAPATIYVDEADRLRVELIDMLRDIYDLTGAPVVLIGEQHLPGKLAQLSRIDDRIPEEYRVAMTGITTGDVALYAMEAADLALSPAACALLHKQARGNFRRVHNLLLTVEAAARAAGTDSVDLPLVQAALPRARR